MNLVSPVPVIRSLEAVRSSGGVLLTLPRGPVESTCIALSQNAVTKTMLLRVKAGMHAPLRLEGAVRDLGSTPVITLDGTMYAPKYDSLDVFAFDGTPLPSLPLADLGLRNIETISAAFFDGLEKDTGTGTLLLANAMGAASKLVAVDAATRAVRWSAALGGDCYGIAVLPVQGVVVASDSNLRKLHAHRFSDGTRMASVTAFVVPRYVAADSATATVYASTANKVTAFRWNGAALVFDGVVEGATTGTWRPIAVMPPAPGQCTSYLVVGTEFSTTLRVFSLPDRRLVHVHRLEGICVAGLAADPSGTALAVCGYTSKAIHVLPWPLPGVELADL